MCPQYFKPGHLESNQDQRIQSPVCCHCTMPQRSQYFSIVFKPCKQLPAPIHRLGLSHACHPSFCLSALLNRPRRSCARSGDYPSVSRWAQAAQSGFVGCRSVFERTNGDMTRHLSGFVGCRSVFERTNGDMRRHHGAINGRPHPTFLPYELRIKGCSLRLRRVQGRETTHPFHGGHRRHNQVS